MWYVKVFLPVTWDVRFRIELLLFFTSITHWGATGRSCSSFRCVGDWRTLPGVGIKKEVCAYHPKIQKRQSPRIVLQFTCTFEGTLDYHLHRDPLFTQYCCLNEAKWNVLNRNKISEKRTLIWTCQDNCHNIKGHLLIYEPWLLKK